MLDKTTKVRGKIIATKTDMEKKNKKLFPRV